MNHSKRYIAAFVAHQRGASMVEFALLLPILIVLFIGAIEISRYILILQKVDKTAYTIADIITRTPPVTTTPPEAGMLTMQEMADIVEGFSDLMAPYSATDRGIISATSVHKPVGSDAPLIKWQYVGGGTMPDRVGELSSEITGRPLSEALPALRDQPIQPSPYISQTLAKYNGLRDQENMIVVEIFYLYQPMINQVFFDIGEVIFNRKAFFTPRYGALTDLPPDFEG